MNYNFKSLSPKKIWFTSDNHFMHKNIIKYTNRPFNNVDEMNEALINNWNSVVKNDDLIFCLGDFALGNEKECEKILERLNGVKVLIKGNHEKTVLSKEYNRSKFDGGIFDRLEIRVLDKDLYKGHQDITLSHYPMVSWNKSHRGSFQLFGHVHGDLDGSHLLGKQLDVGVDSHNFTPINYQTLKDLIQ